MSKRYRRKNSKNKHFCKKDNENIKKNVMPFNCRTPCPYGKSSAFCFPCLKQLINEYETDKGIKRFVNNPESKDKGIEVRANDQ